VITETNNIVCVDKAIWTVGTGNVGLARLAVRKLVEVKCASCAADIVM